MIDANKDTSPEVLERLREASYERFRIQLLNAVEKLLEDFEMSWDDLAWKLQWNIFPEEVGRVMSGEQVKREIGESFLTDEEFNDIAHCFSAEPYIIFRPRKPWIKT